jgi:hypothetical protein
MKAVCILLLSIVLLSCGQKTITELPPETITDKTGNYWGTIWLEKYKGQDVFVTNMGLGSGGIMYYFF